MNEELFIKLKLKPEQMTSYAGGPLATFNKSPNFQDRRTNTSRRTIKAKFLVVPFPSVYNFILGRTTLASLGAVPSMIHLRMKYHGQDDVIVTIHTYIRGTRRCLRVVMKALHATQIFEIE
ncbi:hypothetical protein L195_g025351 [Trifolium pratense]|uniref:Uncharacterized protein n=1 Tax=Trifolium pratense TaxID=57577 RepID=A0A2K3NG88_TRIPR|nr:hypothetical protein L195_g025351 [Trifolium pratense]